jgi:hypothetical protein
MTVQAGEEITRIEALRFDVARSLRHHEKRRAFFETLGKSLEFLALIGSAGAVLALLEVDTKSGAIVLSSLAAIALLVNLVLSPSSKRERHIALRNRLLDLQERLDAGNLTASDLQRCAEIRVEIRKDERPGSPGLAAR